MGHKHTCAIDKRKCNLPTNNVHISIYYIHCNTQLYLYSNRLEVTLTKWNI